MPRLLPAVALTLAVSQALIAQPAPPAGDRIALVNANVVNVATGAVQDGQTLVLAGGRIQSIGTAAPPAGVKVVNVANRWVLPGLIDAHVHIASLPEMRAALQSGVTTARSAGVSSYADVGLRELVKKGYVPGPDLLASGYHVRTFPAPELFLTDPDLGDLLGGVTTVDAIRRVVRANLSHGAEWIKVTATERAGTPDTDPRKQMFSESELEVIVGEAALKSVPVMAHAHGAEGAHAAVKAGVRSIEHGTYLTEETLSLMAKMGTFFVPTADIVNDLAEPGGDYDNPVLQRRGQMMLPILKHAIQRAKALNVKIGAGSDTSYGAKSITTLAREIVMLADSGLTPLDALQAATTRNAELLRLEKEVGQVAQGFQADLIVVAGNPLQDVRTVLDPLLVVSNGKVAVDRLTFGR
ncbi:MAG TPA: amidohydrolase family protein [Vicinamibacterales bacterium]|jgi:imidazolonepropionase-like amidohydrolase|nr:amidohydrolase family protein [Vicinamibacterales bacterium]